MHTIYEYQNIIEYQHRTYSLPFARNTDTTSTSTSSDRLLDQLPPADVDIAPEEK
jgi:hypothetical protein